MRLDSQQVELIARAALEAKLMQEGFEVARPNRDKGIDLIVYLDEPERSFAALPLQLKASSGDAFGVYRKYEGMIELIHVYIWNAVTDFPAFYFMTYSEAASLIPPERKRTSSWTRDDGKAGWRWPTAPVSIRAALQPFENRWAWLRQRLEASRT